MADAKHVAELLDDLAEKFLGSYDAAHERSAFITGHIDFLQVRNDAIHILD
jgi:hypothetical protein